MTLKVFSVFDSKAEGFLNPVFSQSLGVMVRSFTEAALDQGDPASGRPPHDFCKFAEDFTLFELGSFDQAKGVFDLHAAPKSIMLAIEAKREER